MAASVSTSSKRKAIADSNRAMLIWVAGMSAVVGICVVLSISLVKQIEFRARLVGDVNTTAKRLEDNNRNAKELTQGVLALESSDALGSVKTDADEKALQVILDALPADRNTLALGASLQKNLLTGVRGVEIDSMVVDPEGSFDIPSDLNVGVDEGVESIPIQMKISSSSADAIKSLLLRLESSIRVIDIAGMNVEVGKNKYTVTLQALAYYTEPVMFELTERPVSRR